MAVQPAGSPMCWGKQYGDEDDECKNCDYKVTCRPETINHISTRRTTGPNLTLPPNYQLPVVQQQAAPRFGMPFAPQAPTLPQPSGYPRPMSQPPVHPMAYPGQQQYQQPTMEHQPHAPAGWNTPIAYLPRPNPANPAWWQYQGETTGSRLGKNILLTALQAIFSELLRFFANWTWPTVPSRT